MAASLDDLLSRTGLDVPSTANLLRQISNFPPLEYAIVDGVLTTGSTLSIVNHGLGRPYVGAIIIGSSYATGLEPQLADGLDPRVSAKTIWFLTAVAAPATLKFRALVF